MAARRSKASGVLGFWRWRWWIGEGRGCGAGGKKGQGRGSRGPGSGRKAAGITVRSAASVARARRGEDGADEGGPSVSGAARATSGGAGWWACGSDVDASSVLLCGGEVGRAGGGSGPAEADWAGAGFAGPSGKERWAAGWAVVLGAGLGLPFLFLFLSLFYF